MEDIQSLRADLLLKQRQLQLVQEIDRIRDRSSDPTQVFQAVVELLGGLLSAGAGYMYLFDQVSGEIRLQASSVNPEIKPWIESFLSDKLVDQLSRLVEVATWQSQASSLPGLPAGFFGVITPIRLNGDKLGFLLFLREATPFAGNDLQLLETAEDQIDSLVLHELILMRHQQTAHELEINRKQMDLLVSIDAIRDTEKDPAALHSAVVDLLANQLQSDLCLLFLIDRESGVDELKAVYDRSRRFGQLQPVISSTLEKESNRRNTLVAWSIPSNQLAEPGSEISGELFLASVPIVLENEQFGFFLLARTHSEYSPDDLRLLETAESQIDSAIVQGYLQSRYQESIAEVETIYQIDQIRDQDITLDEILNHVLKVMVERIRSEMGFIALYDRVGTQLELRASTEQDLFRSWSSYPLFEQVMNEALEQGRMVAHQDLAPNIHSIACLPLMLNEQVIGVLGMVNRVGKRGFTQTDQRTLAAIGSQIDTAIYERREIRMLRQVLGRSVDPRVMDRLLKNPSLDVLKPERVELTVLYADIRGSTNLAEQTEPEILVEFIRDYLTQMTEVIFAHDGTVDKFVGDEVMALFGAPIPQEDHALRAVRAGLAMQERHQQIMFSWQKRGLPAPPIGIGIVTGRMIIGEMGGSQRANYTVISREANLGARICSAAEGGQVLVSESTYQLVRERVVARPISGQQFKGVERPVTVYHIQKVIN